MSNLFGIKNLDKKTIITLTLIILIVIASIIATIVVLNNKTEEVAQIEEVIEAKVVDVADSNIKFEYNEEPTAEAVALNIKDYDKSYNLYYYIKEVGQAIDESAEQLDTPKQENQEQEITDNEYVLYTGQAISVESNSILSFKYEKDGKFSENAYQIQITNIINEGEIAEGATEEELKEANVEEEEKEKSGATYYIKINYTANCVTIYKKDESGNYTIPVKAMVCSTGTATPTKGTYKTMNKYVWKELNGHCWGQYSTRIVGHILFHSVPYSSPNKDDLKYNLYDKLGTRASAGCIRLTTADAKWIYDNCSLGTMVEFYSSSNPGPLGKPGAQKIASVPECRNWDPTDPAPGNPWKTWSGKTLTTKAQEQVQAQPQQPQQPQPVKPTQPVQPVPESPAPSNNDNKSSDEEESKENQNNTNTDNKDKTDDKENKDAEENKNDNNNPSSDNTSGDE